MIPLVPIIALVIGSKLLKAQKTADKLEYFPKNLEIINKKLVFKMDILNPTKNKLKIDSFFAGIFEKSNKIGTIEKGDSFLIEADKRTTVSFPVKLNALGLLKFGLGIASAKTIDFRIVGVARALGIDTPIDQDLSLNA